MKLLRRIISYCLRSIIDDRVRHFLLYEKRVYGPMERVTIDHTAVVNNALFNTISGTIVVQEYAFFGHNVSVLTGSHDINTFDWNRQHTTPSHGNDIVIMRGAWVASNATIIGPCKIGRHAVVAAGAIVTKDVDDFAIVAGIPARQIGTIRQAQSGLHSSITP